MTDYFKNIPEIKYEGENSSNPLAFKFYDEDKIVLGKTMKEHLRFATCYWHTFTWPGLDPFGGQTFDRPWMQVGDEMKMAEMKLDAAFDFFTKIKTPFFCFHDRDISPEGSNYAETQKKFLSYNRFNGTKN
jgi:xylose isomerase